jgi:hypothetical protein
MPGGRKVSKPKYPVELLQISRLGCMKKSTRVDARGLGTVEHIEVWVPEPEKAGFLESSGTLAPSPKNESN